MQDLREFEEKWLIHFPIGATNAKSLRKALPILTNRLRNLRGLNEELEVNLERIAKEPIISRSTAYDSYYEAVSGDKVVLDSCSIEDKGESGCISYQTNRITRKLTIFRKNGSEDPLSISEQFRGFLAIISGYHHHLNEIMTLNSIRVEIPHPYRFRIRRINGDGYKKFILTAKYKHQRRDGEPETNTERQFYVNSIEEAQEFLTSLGFGYVYSKTKEKAVTDFNYRGYRVKCERNEIPELLGARFLEIEIEGSVKDNKEIYETIHSLAAELGISNSKAKLKDGGLLVTRGYIGLIRRFNNYLTKG